MATHSESAFNESKEVNILSGLLESKRKIKTFFKENDRTPNHDGNFEIVNDDATPKKQFIVQIKKVENLQSQASGKNKGKHVYSIDTSFLYYVKEHVIESPAIYFVVDIITENVFWLYLSDEKLMALDFEGKDTVSYAFSEDEILRNIDEFTSTVNEIADKRNTIFLDKSPAEISEMQDAVEYINNYINNDFVKIKEEMFPNLWRFGLRHSHTSSFSMTIGEKTINPNNTGAFCLYPQIKGGKDTGIQEFNGRNEAEFFTNFDLTGNVTPMEYSKETLAKIVKAFFEKEYAFKFFPTIALCEKYNLFAKEIGKIFDITDGNGKVLIEQANLGFFWLLKYVESVIANNPQRREEIEFNRSIASSLNIRGPHNCDMILLCFSHGCDKYFAEFCNMHDVTVIPRFNFKVLNWVKESHIRAFLIGFELANRKQVYLDPVWTYNFFDLVSLESTEYLREVDAICNRWFGDLAEMYNEVFDQLFDKNKYRLTGRFEYKNVDIREGKSGPWLSNVIRKYSDKKLIIVNNPNVGNKFNDEDRDNGLLSIQNGLTFGRFLYRKCMIYESLNCLLYKGVCNGLGIKCESLSVEHDCIDLF